MSDNVAAADIEAQRNTNPRDTRDVARMIAAPYHPSSGYADDTNPLARHTTTATILPPSGWELSPAAHKRYRDFGNPAPLGLSAFALTTFVLSLINVQTRSVTEPHIVVALAFFYGGTVQLLAGMWEFACGNTFGATALSSYGGFWLSYGAILTPAFGITTAYGDNVDELNSALGFYLAGWFIFTFLLVLCTLRSTVAFFILFFSLDMAFLMLSISNFQSSVACQKAGGAFGLIAAFAAWYNALAGLVTTENAFFRVPVIHFPWSDKVRSEKRGETNGNANPAAAKTD